MIPNFLSSFFCDYIICFYILSTKLDLFVKIKSFSFYFHCQLQSIILFSQRRSSSRHGNGLSSRPPTLPRHSQPCSSRVPGALPGALPGTVPGGGVPGGVQGDVPGKVPLGVPPDQLSQWTGLLEKVSEVKFLHRFTIHIKHLHTCSIKLSSNIQNSRSEHRSRN